MRGPIAAALLAVLLVGAPPAAAAAHGRYAAETRRTQGGMPHIKGRDPTERAIRNDPAYTRERVTGSR